MVKYQNDNMKKRVTCAASKLVSNSSGYTWSTVLIILCYTCMIILFNISLHLTLSFSGSWDECLVDSGEDQRQKPHQLHQCCSPDVCSVPRGAGRHSAVQRGNLRNSDQIYFNIMSPSTLLQASARSSKKGIDSGCPGAAGERSQCVSSGRERSAFISPL